MYHILPKYSERYAWANHVDQTQVLLKEGLHCLPFSQDFLDTLLDSQMDFLK